MFLMIEVEQQLASPQSSQEAESYLDSTFIELVTLQLTSSLEHLDNKNIYVRHLLIDSSSIFNTILPFGLISKLYHSEDNKTKELIIDFRKKGEHAPIYINGTQVERVESVKFLEVAITDNLSWTSHVDVTVKKAQQCLFFLRWLRKLGMPKRSLTNFYRCTIESILS
eukprot:g35136.t1